MFVFQNENRNELLFYEIVGLFHVARVTLSFLDCPEETWYYKGNCYHVVHFTGSGRDLNICGEEASHVLEFNVSLFHPKKLFTSVPVLEVDREFLRLCKYSAGSKLV